MVVVEETVRVAPPSNVKPETSSLLLDSDSRLPAAPASSNTTTTTIKCPECGSQRVWKDGIRYTHFGEVQRYICRECSYRFSHTDPSEPSERLQKLHTLILKTKADKTILCQIGAAQLKGAKNLVEVETRIQEKAAGATPKTLDEATIKGKLIEFAFWLSKQGYNEEVSKNRAYLMRRLVNLGANLWDPETVKEVLAKQNIWNNGYKMLISYAYQSFLTMEGLSWKRPRYTPSEAFPFIPTEAELDQLTSACSKKVGTFLQGLKDTGCDPGELAALKWIDINKESRTVQIRPVKGHNPRVLGVSQQFLDRVERLPKISERIFNLRRLRPRYTEQRKRIANKFANPRLLKIAFTTFRHWKATTEYHRTKDILYVKKLLGHKNIQNTLKYIDLEATIFGITDDQFTVRVANNVQEACTLIEAGFEYVTGEYHDGGKIFRKRK